MIGWIKLKIYEWRTQHTIIHRPIRSFREICGCLHQALNLYLLMDVYCKYLIVILSCVVKGAVKNTPTLKSPYPK